jgi:hypothetical protein
MKQLRRLGGPLSGLLVVAAAILGPTLLAGQRLPAGSAPDARQAPSAQRADQAPAGLPDFVGALKATPGCLGVETARTSSGKQVIFAWFENKKAALNWYYSDTHRSLVKMFAPGGPARTPLAGVPDDGSPILAIASLTPGSPGSSSGSPSAPPASGGAPLNVSQIAIELYRPLPGGLAAGGRFSPSSLNVPGLVDVPMPPK